LLDGTEFDSSERVGKSVQFNVSEIMLGWQEALKLMAEGSIWQIFIPPHLAYGLRGGGAGCWSKRNPDFRNRATEC
jgi:FKBP-type peptidyl-prolyl cis-trans isomerase